MVFGVPPTMGVTTQDAGSDDAIDSDINVYGRTGPINVAASSPETTVSAGFTGTPASIGDLVWNDENYDGLQQAGEPGLDGVSVTLQTCGSNVDIETVTTDANGTYAFTDVAPGCYHLVFSDAPPGFVATSPSVGSDASVNSDINATGKTADFMAIGTMQDMDAGFVNSTSNTCVCACVCMCVHVCACVCMFLFVCACFCLFFFCCCFFLLLFFLKFEI